MSFTNFPSFSSIACIDYSVALRRSASACAFENNGKWCRGDDFGVGNSKVRIALNEEMFAERMGDDIPPQQRIEDMIRVAELCVELLKENNEYHGEVSLHKTTIPRHRFIE